MKALTICQPYAEMIARGEKRAENRTWTTHYRGPLLIHAGKSRVWLAAGEAADYVFGAIVARTTLIDVVRIEQARAGAYGDLYPWLATHTHARGPWCWVLGDVERLDRPIPWRGALGLFEVEA